MCLASPLRTPLLYACIISLVVLARWLGGIDAMMVNNETKVAESPSGTPSSSPSSIAASTSPPSTSPSSSAASTSPPSTSPSSSAASTSPPSTSPSSSAASTSPPSTSPSSSSSSSTASSSSSSSTSSSSSSSSSTSLNTSSDIASLPSDTPINCNINATASFTYAGKDIFTPSVANESHVPVLIKGVFVADLPYSVGVPSFVPNKMWNWPALLQTRAARLESIPIDVSVTIPLTVCQGILTNHLVVTATDFDTSGKPPTAATIAQGKELTTFVLRFDTLRPGTKYKIDISGNSTFSYIMLKPVSFPLELPVFTTYSALQVTVNTYLDGFHISWSPIDTIDALAFVVEVFPKDSKDSSDQQNLKPLFVDIKSSHAFYPMLTLLLTKKVVSYTINVSYVSLLGLSEPYFSQNDPKNAFPPPMRIGSINETTATLQFPGFYNFDEIKLSYSIKIEKTVPLRDVLPPEKMDRLPVMVVIDRLNAGTSYEFHCDITGTSKQNSTNTVSMALEVVQVKTSVGVLKIDISNALAQVYTEDTLSLTVSSTGFADRISQNEVRLGLAAVDSTPTDQSIVPVNFSVNKASRTELIINVERLWNIHSSKSNLPIGVFISVKNADTGASSGYTFIGTLNKCRSFDNSKHICDKLKKECAWCDKLKVCVPATKQKILCSSECSKYYKTEQKCETPHGNGVQRCRYDLLFYGECEATTCTINYSVDEMDHKCKCRTGSPCVPDHGTTGEIKCLSGGLPYCTPRQCKDGATLNLQMEKCVVSGGAEVSSVDAIFELFSSVIFICCCGVIIMLIVITIRRQRSSSDTGVYEMVPMMRDGRQVGLDDDQGLTWRDDAEDWNDWQVDVDNEPPPKLSSPIHGVPLNAKHRLNIPERSGSGDNRYDGRDGPANVSELNDNDGWGDLDLDDFDNHQSNSNNMYSNSSPTNPSRSSLDKEMAVLPPVLPPPPNFVKPQPNLTTAHPKKEDDENWDW